MVPTNYKTDAGVRASIIADLQLIAPWLDLAGVEREMVGSDDGFDAVVAALIARAHAIGGTHSVSPTLREQADREGWIAVPSVAVVSIIGSVEH